MPVFYTQGRFEELREGKEKSSHVIYRLQGSVRHDAPLLVKRGTKNRGSDRQDLLSIRSEHV